MHGYNNNSPTVARTTCHYPRQFQVDPEREVWVTYDWPGERGWVSPGTWRAALATGWEVAGSLLFLLPVLLVLAGLVTLFGALAAHTHVAPYGRAGLAAVAAWKRVLPGDVSAFLALISVLLGLIVVLLGLSLLGALPFLRLSSYPPRSLHGHASGGARSLRVLFATWITITPTNTPRTGKRRENPLRSQRTTGPASGRSAGIGVDIIAHSMGCLLTLNVVRILSDLFIAPGPQQQATPSRPQPARGHPGARRGRRAGGAAPGEPGQLFRLGAAAVRGNVTFSEILMMPYCTF